MKYYQVAFYIAGWLFTSSLALAQERTVGDTLRTLTLNEISSWSSAPTIDEDDVRRKASSVGNTTFYQRIDATLRDTPLVDIATDSVSIVYYYDDHEYDEYAYLVVLKNGMYSYFQYDYMESKFKHLGQGKPRLITSFFEDLAQMNGGIDSNLYFTTFIVEGQVKDFVLAKSFARFPHLNVLVTFMDVLNDTLQD